MNPADRQAARRVAHVDKDGMASIVATLGPFHDRPWWWQHLEADRDLCPLDYERLTHRGRHSQHLSTLEIPFVLLKVLPRLLRWRGRYSHVFTFECDLVGFSIAFWQSITGMRRPQHVILQFIMRERQDTLPSRAKYALMRFLFSSVARAIVSSSAEVDYYRNVFKWPEGKVQFVPFHTDPELVERTAESEKDYVLAAGRTFRDYETLVRAVAGTTIRLLIVGGSGSRAAFSGEANVRVMENIPQLELHELMRSARIIAIPLQDRAISTGQSVLLHAMGIGKPVVATRTAGTVDYIEHMVDGVLVPPGDPEALRGALLSLDDDALRKRLGKAARSRVLSSAMPHHYSAAVRSAVQSNK